MAKRRRLGPAMITANLAEQDGGTAPMVAQGSAAPPIARVAGAAAAEAAVRELSDELTRARAEGRMVQEIALDDIDEGYLSRDRIAVDAADQEALIASIAARGQQMPIELVDKWAPAQAPTPGSAAPTQDRPRPRYGLISGWRRLAALRTLAIRDPDRPPMARAILRRPEAAAEAYLSMVEENELRVGLSYYERAQVAARAADLGVFATTADAVQGLFPTASKAKRSKIGAFIRIFYVLDQVLRFPDAIPERLGLRMVKALEADHGRVLYEGLAAHPAETSETEIARIEALLAQISDSKPPRRVETARFAGDLVMTRAGKVLKLSGAGVDDALAQDLTLWLTARNAARR